MRNRLFRLKRLRTSVDYDLDYADVEMTVSDALEDAERLIVWIDELP